jgi:hypothetical protein
LWDFPGTISRVAHVGGISFDIDSFAGNQMSWNPKTLFTAPERNPPPRSLPGEEQEGGGRGNRFGRRPVWDTLNSMERVGQGCY